MPVAVLFCFGQLCLLHHCGLNKMEGFCFVNFAFVTKFFVSTLLIVIQERNQFLDDVSVSILPPVSTVLAGDFNTVFNRSLDLRASDPFHASCESSCALNRLLNACSSIDIWSYLHPTSSSYTWTRSNRSLPSRIDS